MLQEPDYHSVTFVQMDISMMDIPKIVNHVPNIVNTVLNVIDILV